jgi:hypothetical protein
MVLALERHRLISRLTGVARSIILQVSPEILPPLASQPFKSFVQTY